MANLNKVMLIGRLTRDPEMRTFPNGGKVAQLGFAVNNRRKNPSSGQWEDEPVFLDIEAFNRDTGRKLADLVEQYMHKGKQFYIEGRLKLDQWTSQDGQKRSKLKIVMDDFQFLEPRADGAGGSYSGGAGGGARSAAPSRPPASDSYGGEYGDPGSVPDTIPMPESPSGDDIPF